MKNKDCVDINKDFLATRLNYLLEHTVIVKKNKTKSNIESYSLNERAQKHDLIETIPSCTLIYQHQMLELTRMKW